MMMVRITRDEKPACHVDRPSVMQRCNSEALKVESFSQRAWQWQKKSLRGVYHIITFVSPLPRGKKTQLLSFSATQPTRHPASRPAIQPLFPRPALCRAPSPSLPSPSSCSPAPPIPPIDGHSRLLRSLTVSGWDGMGMDAGDGTCSPPLAPREDEEDRDSFRGEINKTTYYISCSTRK